MKIGSVNRSFINKRKSTIIIEEDQDSLLDEQHMKQFIEKDYSINSKTNQSGSSSHTSQASHQSNGIKFCNTSQGFFRQSLNNKNGQFNINSFRITGFSKSTHMTYQPNQFQNNSFSKKNIFRNKRNHQNSKQFIKSDKRKQQITNLIQNKKLWSTEMLKSSLIVKNKPSLIKQNGTPLSSRSNMKNSTLKLLKTEIIKSVSNSTWMKLNPETIKMSLINLSKNQKNDRKRFFALKQGAINQQNGLRSVNKSVLFRNLSQRSFHDKSINQKGGLIHRNLSSRQLVNHKIYSKRIKRITQLQKKGIFLRGPFKDSSTIKHDFISQPDTQYL